MKLFPQLNLNIFASETPYNFFAGNSRSMALKQLLPKNILDFMVLIS
jgi:hypothetical protein